MPPANHTTKKTSKFLDIKVFIATLSLAVTMLLWNLFSSQAVQAEKAAASNPEPQQLPAADTLGLPPLPTVAPLIQVNSAAAPADRSVSAPVAGAAAVDQAGIPIRSVDAPAAGTIVQKFAPVIADTSQAGGGGGGGGSRAVRRTRTS